MDYLPGRYSHQQSITYVWTSLDLFRHRNYFNTLANELTLDDVISVIFTAMEDVGKRIANDQMN